MFIKISEGCCPACLGNERGHRVIIDMKYKAEVEALSHDIGLRGIVFSHKDDTPEVEVDKPDTLTT